jgi:hypothetical protein
MMTWASYLSPTGILYISSPYMSTSTGVCSVLTLLHYVISAARSEVEEGKPAWKLPKPHQLPDPDNDDGGDQSAHKLSGSKASSKRRQGASSSNKHRRKTSRRDDQDENSQSTKTDSKKKTKHPTNEVNKEGMSIKLLHIMMKHEDRETWCGRIVSTKQLVAVKGYHSKTARDREVHCYNLLASMQGQCIPFLLNSDFNFTVHGHNWFGLVIEWIRDKDVMISTNQLSKHVLSKARAIVVQMHRKGVVHRDLRNDNLNYNPVTDEVYIYDFSDANTREQLGEHKFKKECHQDLQQLDELFKWAEQQSSDTNMFNLIE